MTTTVESVEEDGPEDSETTMEASAEESEDTTHLSERLQWRRRRCVYGPRELMKTKVASAEEDGPKESDTKT